MKPEAKPLARQPWGGASASWGGRGVRGSAPPPAGRPTWPLGREEAPAGLPGIQLGAESGQVGGTEVAEAHPPPRGRWGEGSLGNADSALRDPVPSAGPAFPLILPVS